MRPSISGELNSPGPPGIFILKNYLPQINGIFLQKIIYFPPQIRYFSQLIYGGKMIVEGAGPQESIYPFPPIFWFLPSPG